MAWPRYGNQIYDIYIRMTHCITRSEAAIYLKQGSVQAATVNGVSFGKRSVIVAISHYPLPRPWNISNFWVKLTNLDVCSLYHCNKVTRELDVVMIQADVNRPDVSVLRLKQWLLMLGQTETLGSLGYWRSKAEKTFKLNISICKLVSRSNEILLS